MPIEVGYLRLTDPCRHHCRDELPRVDWPTSAAVPARRLVDGRDIAVGKGRAPVADARREGRDAGRRNAALIECGQAA